EVFPLPFGPINPVIKPLGIVNVKSSMGKSFRSLVTFWNSTVFIHFPPHNKSTSFQSNLPWLVPSVFQLSLSFPIHSLIHEFAILSIHVVVGQRQKYLFQLLILST